MSHRLVCHHGHLIETTEDVQAGEIFCGRCGSLAVTQANADTHRRGALDVTIASDNQPEAAPLASERPSSRLWLASSDIVEESSFLTAAYESKADGSLLPLPARHTRDLPAGSDQNFHPGNGARNGEAVTPPALKGFEVLDELGRGGMGIVYRARDTAHGREVALKTLLHMNPDSLQRFKSEFRSLADIAHPNLVTLYELLSDGETWCISMEILHGVDFLEYVWSGFENLGAPAGVASSASCGNGHERLTRDRLERLTEALQQLATGLSALHSEGILHTDIKPSNVFMTTEGRLVLLDFGLAIPLRRTTANLHIIQGTPRYMSPEQAFGEELTEASDWYAVGVMLYEVLIGRPPFVGRTMDVLTRKRAEAIEDPAIKRPETPPHLTALCRALLDRDPANRPNGVEVLRRLGATNPVQVMAPSASTAKPQLTELVGRERHLAVIESAYADVVAGETRSLFIHGRSGMGKSVLVRRFLEGHDVQQAVVLQGRCYEQESLPFKAVDSLVDDLTDYLDGLSEHRMHAVMPRDRRALTRVFPVFGRLSEELNASYPSIDSADQQELRQRAMNALRELLQRLSMHQPLILYVDDLQWGDFDSAELLADLVRPPDAPRMLMLACFRTEDVNRSQCLQTLADAYQRGEPRPHREELAVDALCPAEATRLAMQLLGDDAAHRQIAERIAEESAGWPFFVWELVQHVQEDPTIAERALDLDEVIWTRVNRLPEETRQLLQLIAIAGRPLSATELFHALDAVAKGPGAAGSTADRQPGAHDRVGGR